MEKKDAANNKGKKPNEKKLQLIAISKKMRELVKLGKAESINEALKKFVYAPAGHTDLKTLKEWNEEGKKVKKGSQALLVWSSPIKGKKHLDSKEKPTESPQSSEDEEFSFWNICYLFSNLQVEQSSN